MDNIKLLKQFGTVVKLTEYALKLTNELKKIAKKTTNQFNTKMQKTITH